MINFTRDRSTSSLSRRREETFSASGDVRGGVDPRTTHFSSQKVYFSIDRHEKVVDHLSAIAQNLLCCNIGVDIVQLLLPMVFCSVFLMVIVDMVWCCF